MPVVITLANQYCPVSDQENDVDNPLSVRAMRDMVDNVNIQQVYAGNREIINQCWMPALHFPVDEPLVETVVQAFAPRFVPVGFNQLRYILGYKIGAGSNVTVALYCSKNHYNGDLAFDSTKLDSASNDWFSASSATHTFAVGTLDTIVNPGQRAFITITATREDNTSELYLTTLTIIAELNI